MDCFSWGLENFYGEKWEISNERYIKLIKKTLVLYGKFIYSLPSKSAQGGD